MSIPKKSLSIEKNIISIENLLQIWESFARGKRRQKDVKIFERNLEDNIWELYYDLNNGLYRHGKYLCFSISDSKKRSIHKASVRDRLVHRFVWNNLKSIFEKDFIKHLYSSVKWRGYHKMIKSIIVSCRRVSLEYKSCFILHMDIKKYFESIDHNILLNIISKNENLDNDILEFATDIIKSFEVLSGKGIPLGNVTSQIFANIYLSEFDKIMIRHKRCHFYTRYNDDIFIIHNDIDFLKKVASFSINWFEKERKLCLPTEKIKIRKISNGCNVLGVVIYKNKLKLKNSTKQRIFERISMKNKDSYFGMLKNPDFFDLKQKLRSILDL